MVTCPHRSGRVFLATLAQGRTVLRGTWTVAVENWGKLALVPLLSVILALLFFPHDRELLAGLHGLYPDYRPVTREIAWYFSTFGDYPTYNIPLALGLWLYGAFARKSAWRRIAVVCFLGATFAGVLDDCFRLTLGRPRPDANVADGFYGLPDALRGRWESFPSGHAAAVFGASTALLLVDRRLGFLATIYSLLVVWARMELDRHYPSDVTVGSLVGITLGLLVGLGAQVRRPRLGPPRTAPVSRPARRASAHPAVSVR